MTEQERKVLERDAARLYPEIAFKLGKIVAIDEILSLMADTVADNQDISGKALAVATLLIYSDVKKRLSEEVNAAYES
jgi:hypothetical protein